MIPRRQPLSAIRALDLRWAVIGILALGAAGCSVLVSGALEDKPAEGHGGAGGGTVSASGSAGSTSTTSTAPASSGGVMCPEGLADCDQDAGTGCEVDTTTDIDHCGKCDVVCAPNHASVLCVDSACVLTCQSGFDDCNHLPGDGCEVNLKKDDAHCGDCDHECPAGQKCVNQACKP